MMFSKAFPVRGVQTKDCVAKGEMAVQNLHFLSNIETSSLLIDSTVFQETKLLTIYMVQTNTINLSQLSFLTHYQTTNFILFQTNKVCRRQFQI